MEIIESFLAAMSAAGCAPARSSDIIANDKRTSYQIAHDPKNKKKGFYKLKVDADFGFGYFGDYSQDSFFPWHSTSPKKYTQEEIRAFAERARIAREEAEAERMGGWQEKSQEAQDTLIFASLCEAHPYLTKKGVKPYGLYASGNLIIMPLRDVAQIWNYQTIDEAGNKLFLKGGRKNGTWFEIPGDEVICICEGYATGASIHEATGHSVIVGLDAGNITVIAPKIRDIYKLNKIIICADNDQFNAKNIGIEKGKEAAIAISAKLVYPEFKDLSSKPTDFNDLHALEGLERVKDIIHSASKLDEEAAGGVIDLLRSDSQTPGGDLLDWRSLLQKNDKGIIQRSTTNINLFVRHEERIAGTFKHDSFAKRIILHKCPPWENENEFRVRPVADYDYFRLESFLESAYGLKATKDKCADVIQSTAQLPENTFNPASEYFLNLKWDGVSRINSWLKDFVSDGSQPDEYLSLVGTKFLCGLAARAMHPGVKFDTMIILEGKQYAGKSYLSRILATINDTEYFLDDFKDIDNKDALMKIQGKLVVEFPEMNTMRRAEVNDLKAFLSRTTDVFRPPYGRNTIESGRQCVFVGTINPEGPYLRDVTGNRRYWPIACRDSFDLDKLKEIVPHLHAEAAMLVKCGEQIWLNPEEFKIAVAEQEKRVVEDVWTDSIAEIVENCFEITTDEIMQKLEIPKERRSPNVQSRVTQTMVGFGWEPSRITIGRKQRRGFKRHNPIVAANDEGEEVVWAS